MERLLQPIGDYRRACDAHPHRTKRRKVTVTKDTLPKKPETVRELESACLIGLNACTRALEVICQSDSAETSGTHSPSSPAVLFVCKDDARSDLLYNHFPRLCQSSQRRGQDIHLIAMPEGTEAVLGKALGLPRTGCLALKVRGGSNKHDGVKTDLLGVYGHRAHIGICARDDTSPKVTGARSNV